MRDPVDAKKIEAARAGVRRALARLDDAGILRGEEKLEFIYDNPDHEVRRCAGEWLLKIEDGAQVERPPQKVIDMLVGLLFADPKPKRGRRANTLRDRCIIFEISHLVEHGFNATRNETTASPSACSIVADIFAENGLDISESAVAVIWSRRHDL